MIKQLTIIGLGLIGGSIARAIKQTDFCKIIVGYDNDTSISKKASELKIIDQFTINIETAVKHADLIVICVPVAAFEKVLKEIKISLNPNAIITDVASIKANIITQAENILGKEIHQFVPGHPIAGSEKSGLDAIKADLFTNKLVVLTPNENTNPSAVTTVKLFWQAMGAHIKIINATLHDQCLAATSHFPQVLAYLYMQQLQKNPNYPEILEYTGNGFKDFTRLAGSNPLLWADIVLSNTKPLLFEIEQFKKLLNNLQAALENSDEQLLLEIFTQAQKGRKDFDKHA